ncbi:MAG: hypothetical protein O7G85_10875 [Planctomycetota bacterium]|nr:hypothetical protein [Planctomycetota bacterium]
MNESKSQSDVRATNSEGLTDYLRDRDRSCPQCEKNIRGITSQCCPHCGIELILRIGLDQSNFTSFIAGIIIITSGLGFSVFVLFLLICAVLTSIGNISQLQQLVVALGLGIVISLVALLLWLRLGRWMRCQTKGRRRFIVALSMLVPLTSLALFLMVRYFR